MSEDNGRRQGQPAWAYEMEIALTREISAVKEKIPSEDRIRILAREEMGLTKRDIWNTRSVMTALAMFGLAVSTFVLTVLRGSGHGP